MENGDPVTKIISFDDRMIVRTSTGMIYLFTISDEGVTTKYNSLNYNGPGDLEVYTDDSLAARYIIFTVGGKVYITTFPYDNQRETVLYQFNVTGATEITLDTAHKRAYIGGSRNIVVLDLSSMASVTISNTFTPAIQSRRGLTWFQNYLLIADTYSINQFSLSSTSFTNTNKTSHVGKTAPISSISTDPKSNFYVYQVDRQGFNSPSVFIVPPTSSVSIGIINNPTDAYFLPDAIIFSDALMIFDSLQNVNVYNISQPFNPRFISRIAFGNIGITRWITPKFLITSYSDASIAVWDPRSVFNIATWKEKYASSRFATYLSNPRSLQVTSSQYYRISSQTISFIYLSTSVLNARDIFGVHFGYTSIFYTFNYASDSDALILQKYEKVPNSPNWIWRTVSGNGPVVFADSSLVNYRLQVNLTVVNLTTTNLYAVIGVSNLLNSEIFYQYFGTSATLTIFSSLPPLVSELSTSTISNEARTSSLGISESSKAQTDSTRPTKASSSDSQILGMSARTFYSIVLPFIVGLTGGLIVICTLFRICRYRRRQILNPRMAVSKQRLAPKAGEAARSFNNLTGQPSSSPSNTSSFIANTQQTMRSPLQLTQPITEQMPFRSSVVSDGDASFGGDTTLVDDQLLTVPGFLEITAQDYVAIGKIGKGGSGEIMHGKLLGDLRQRLSNGDAQVVIKNITGYDHLSEREKLTAVLQEIAMMWFFRDHPNIVKFYAYCMKPMCMILKFYEFGSLEHFLFPFSSNSTTIPNVSMSRKPHETMIQIGKDLVNALYGMHSVGYVHNDIKPGNLLLENVHGVLRGVLSDFGAATIVDDATLKISGYRKSKIVAHSIRYSPPEVLIRRRQMEKTGTIMEQIKDPYAAKAVDIFGLGVIFHEMITQERAWLEYRDKNSLIDAIISGRQPMISENAQRFMNNDQRLGRWTSIMFTCFNADPTRRPQIMDLYRMMEGV